MTAPSTSLGEAPAKTGLAFEQLYRGCRDDVFAYVMGLLRDVHAAEDATALAFERAYRKRRRPLRTGDVLPVPGRRTRQAGLAVLEVN